MNTICVKLCLSGKVNKYRTMAATNEEVFPNFKSCVATSLTYAPGASLNEGDWFKIDRVSQKEYTIDLLDKKYTTLDFDSLTRNEFPKIDFLFLDNSSIKIAMSKGIPYHSKKRLHFTVRS